MELVPFNPWEPVHVKQGNLPHWQQNRRTYFITWRTGDSIPTGVLRTWHAQRDLWLRGNGVTLEGVNTLPASKQRQYHELFTLPWHAYLDAGHGRCLLRHPNIRQLIEQTLRHFDKERYDLGDFVLMPNHVHLLVTPFPDEDIERLCFSW
jgi:hypothetical protein